MGRSDVITEHSLGPVEPAPEFNGSTGLQGIRPETATLLGVKLRPTLASMAVPVLAIALIAPAASSEVASHQWRIVPSPSPGTNVQLLDVSALSVTDAWAVGLSASPSATFESHTLTEHWDGTSWSVVPSPSPASGPSLSGVLALAPDDVWAVGSKSRGMADRTLIEHWDGSTWRVVPSPSLGASADLNAVMTHGSSGRLWAIGVTQYTLGGQNEPLVEEWNGSRWRDVSPTPPPDGSYPLGGASDSKDDAWMVGTVGTIQFGTQAEHWDGSSWSVVATPDTGFASRLSGVAAISASDAWAVGAGGTGALIEHWDGTAWLVVSSPNRNSSSLSGATAASANKVWAAGTYVKGGHYLTLTERWNGTRWAVVTSPNPPNTDSDLVAIAAVPGANQVWAVGSSTASTTTSSLIELFS
jgi:hypothetical protein